MIGWPATRVQGYMQLGDMYAPAAKDPEKALAAFKQALALAPGGRAPGPAGHAYRPLPRRVGIAPGAPAAPRITSDVGQQGIGRGLQREVGAFGPAGVNRPPCDAAICIDTIASQPSLGAAAACATRPHGWLASDSWKTSWPACKAAGVRQVSASLERAPELAARHHLLAGVAALLEVHAARPTRN